MKAEESDKFREKLEKEVFRTSGEEVPVTPPRLPRRAQDVSSVGRRFLTPGGQVFEIFFNTQGGRVAVLIVPPYGNAIHVKKWVQVEWAITQVKGFLDLERLSFRKPNYKVLA